MRTLGDLARPRRRLLAGVSLTLVGGTLLSACSGEEARPVATPKVVWQDGAPASPLEQDPWVQVARAGEVAYASAVNAANFSDTAMLATWDERTIRWLAKRSGSDLGAGTAYVVLGPRPFTPMAVDVDDAGRAASILACVGPLPVVEETPSERGEWPRAMVYGLEVAEDGKRRITGTGDPEDDHALPTGELFSDASCDGVSVAHGLFDPAPNLETLLELDEADVIAPVAPSPTFAVEIPK